MGLPQQLGQQKAEDKEGAIYLSGWWRIKGCGYTPQLPLLVSPIMASLLLNHLLCILALSTAGLLAQEDGLPPPVKPEPRQASCNFAYGFTSVGQQALLQSPGWPNNYPASSACRYSLTSPAGMECLVFLTTPTRDVQIYNFHSSCQVLLNLPNLTHRPTHLTVCPC